MRGSLVVILLGVVSIAILIWMRLTRYGLPHQNEEAKVWRKWNSICILVFLLSLIAPGAVELFGLVPAGSLGLAGATICFFAIVRLGHWYRQRISRLSARYSVEANRSACDPHNNNSRAYLNGTGSE